MALPDCLLYTYKPQIPCSYLCILLTIMCHMRQCNTNNQTRRHLKQNGKHSTPMNIALKTLKCSHLFTDTVPNHMTVLLRLGNHTFFRQHCSLRQLKNVFVQRKVEATREGVKEC